MLPAKLGDGDASFRLAKDGKDLGFAESARLHQNLLVHKARENSTFEARYLPGDYQVTCCRDDLSGIQMGIAANGSIHRSIGDEAGLFCDPGLERWSVFPKTPIKFNNSVTVRWVNQSIKQIVLFSSPMNQHIPTITRFPQYKTI